MPDIDPKQITSVFVALGEDGKSLYTNDEGKAYCYSSYRAAELDIVDALITELDEVRTGERALHEVQCPGIVVHGGFDGTQVTLENGQTFEATMDGNPVLYARGKAYLILIQDQHGVKSADIWSSPEWQQSQRLKDQVTSVLFMWRSENFAKAQEELIAQISQPNSRYFWAYALLKENAGLVQAQKLEPEHG